MSFATCTHNRHTGHPADQDIRKCEMLGCDGRSVDGGKTWMRLEEYQENYCTKEGKMSDLHGNLKTLGESKTTYPMTYDPSVLEVFQNPQMDVDYVISIEAPEFTCLCPKTGQPDFAKIVIEYSPDQLCVESKSLKLYLFSFRQSGAFHEDVTNKIAKDLYNLMKPHWIEVTGEFFPRGGISFWPKVRLEKNDNVGEEDLG